MLILDKARALDLMIANSERVCVPEQFAVFADAYLAHGPAITWREESRAQARRGASYSNQTSVCSPAGTPRISTSISPSEVCQTPGLMTTRSPAVISRFSPSRVIVPPPLRT